MLVCLCCMDFNRPALVLLNFGCCVCTCIHTWTSIWCKPNLSNYHRFVWGTQKYLICKKSLLLVASVCWEGGEDGILDKIPFTTYLTPLPSLSFPLSPSFPLLPSLSFPLSPSFPLSFPLSPFLSLSPLSSQTTDTYKQLIDTGHYDVPSNLLATPLSPPDSGGSSVYNTPRSVFQDNSSRESTVSSDTSRFSMMTENPFDIYDYPRSSLAISPDDEGIYDIPPDIGDMEIYDYPPDASELGLEVPPDSGELTIACLSLAPFPIYTFCLLYMHRW